MSEKVLNNTNMEDTKQNVPNLEVYGNPGAWVLISKASSRLQGWMKSTKAMEIYAFQGVFQGVLVQTETELHEVGSQTTSCSQALCFLPGVHISDLKGEESQQPHG